MKLHRTLNSLGMVWLVASCAHPNVATRPELPLATAQKPTDVLRDPQRIAASQSALGNLGYDPGPADTVIGPRTVEAVRAFQKDQGIKPDGKLTGLLDERLKTVRAKLPGKSIGTPEVGATLYYSDGTRDEIDSVEGGVIQWRSEDGTQRKSQANFFISINPGTTADAPGDFLQPLKPGRTGAYHLHEQAPDGAQRIAATVTCSVGHFGRTTVPAGVFDTLEITCAQQAAGLPTVWRTWLYAPDLKQPVRLTTRADGQAAQTRDIVAIRPGTAAWPQAARAGLDWATTHALDAAASEEPLIWSSTGVTERYAIRVDRTATTTSVAPAAQKCARYELARLDDTPSRRRYPGLACQTKEGRWIIPGRTPYVFASPNDPVKPNQALTALEP